MRHSRLRAAMALRDTVLALFITLVWGLNFIAVRYGLNHYPPFLLTCLRFVLAALPCLFLPRPALPWRKLVAIGTVWFFGQFVLLFLGIAVGMPPGLASLIMQLQAIFTILIAAVALGEHPTQRQMLGCLIAIGGVLVIATTIGGDVTVAGFALVVMAAASWAWGNVMMRRVGRFEMMPMVAWLSIVAPLPAFALSLVFEGWDTIRFAMLNPTWEGVLSLIYLAGPTTLLGYGIWAMLLKRYPAAVVTPFALLVPVFAMIATAIVFGERLGPVRLVGVALILAGLAVLAVPKPAWFGRFLSR